MHDIKWSRTSLGASEIVIFPVGSCSCSHTEFQEGTPPYEYLKAGNPSQLYKENSLFDPKAVENKGDRRSYTSLEWSYHLATITEAVLLERTPAFAIDLMNQIEIPDDTSSEVLLELSNNRENSNFSERTMLRIVFGPFLLRLCSGLLHRFNSLILASSAYDYPPYSVPKQEPLFSELPPPSADDFDALNENIPIKTMQITLVAPVIQIHLLDHPVFVPTKEALFKRKKLSSSGAAQIQTNLPHLTLECQCIDITIKNPMYEKRLLVTTSQLPDPPQHMFEACYQVINGKILGFQSKLVMESKKHTIIIPPTNAAVSQKSILKPQYWINPDVIHDVLLIESENFSITGTKAKLMVVIFIIDSFWKWNDGSQGNVKSILNTSLLKDTINDNGMIYAELSVENIRFKIVSTASTVAIDTCLDSIKGFVYEQIDFECKDNETNLNDGSIRPPTPKKVRFTDIQQVMFISGPESENSNEDNEQSKKPCVSLTVQFPLSPDSQVHASLFVFDMQEITFCCDPLLLKWLCYSPKRTQKVKVEGTSEVSFRKTKTVSETSSNVETSRKLNTPHESVHSSSDREHLHILTTIPKEPKETCEEEPTQFLDFVKRWSGIWTCSLVCGHIEQCTVYIPMTSLSAIGSQNIKQAVHKMLWKSNPSDLLVFVTPEVSLKSSVNYETLAKHIKSLPVDIPSSFWKDGKTSFPWYISVDKFGCYTLHQGRRCKIIKNVSFDATVGFSAKSRPTGPVTKSGSGMVKDLDGEKVQHSLKNRLEYVVSQSNSKIDNENCDEVKSMNVCIHFDMKPVHISLSEVQVCLITNIANGFLDKMRSWIYLTPEPKLPEIVPYFSEASTGSPGLRESIVETASEHESSVEKENKEQATTEWSAWIQWTVTRITFELLAYDAVDLYSDDISYSHPPNLKLMFDFEDIVTSLDYQGIYLKVKSKIASASVKHFKRTRNSISWKPGPVLGILMKERDGVQIDKVKEGSDIFSLTITRASCKHTHALWGTRSKVKSKVKNEEPTDGVRFITEIDLTLQPIDLILPFTILRDFYMVVEPFLNAPQQTIVANNNDDILMNINNQNIPLIYLHVEGVRIVLPSVELDDVCIFQIDDITFTPNAINPIIRTPCRPDIYQQGARSRKLNVPGSDIEDRQYQLDIVGICSSTCLWKDLLTILNVNVKESCHLKTMSENPALEWNNLGKNVLSPEPQFNFWPIIKKFDVSVIFAPAMVYKSDTIVCGHSLEINFVSDIEMFVSVNQVNLLWILMNEFLCIRKSFMMADLTLKRPQVMLQSDRDDRKPNIDPLEQVRDSGIETSEKRSNLSALTTIPFTQECSDVNKIEQDKKTSEKSFSFFNRTPWQIGKQNIPVETVIVGGKLSGSLYLVKNPLAEDKTRQTSKKSTSIAVEFEKGYEGSEEGSENYDLSTNNFLPLVFIYVYQPSLFASFQQVTRKMQVSVSDLKLKSSSNAYKPLRFVPKEENYPINLLETRAGMPHPDTGVLPTFLTLKWNKSLGKPATLDLDFGKPIKFEVSLVQWDYFLTIRAKIAKIFKPSSDGSGEMLPSEQISNLDNIVKHEADVEDVYLNSTHKKTDTYIKLMHIRKSIFGLTSVNVKSYQLMIVFKTAFSRDGILTIGPFKSYLTIPTRPERITNVTHVENITFSVVDNNKCMVLLHPSNVSIESCFFWEPWQTVNSNPQVQVSIDSDNVHFDFGSKYVKCLQMLLKDFNEIVTSFDRTIGEDDNEILADSKSNPESVKSTPSEKEQHYKDDLRAGAFQFVSATTNSPDELPLPYQVMFWEQSIAAMAWRYPQPRVLTKVRVFPVPFKEASEKYREQQVLCSLEYWADCHCSYQPYTQFFLSESEMCYVDLPKHKSYPTVACIWRVVLHPINYKNVATLATNDPSKFLISPKALAACLRIDSYFGRNLVPDLSLAVNVETISLSLYTHFDSDVTYKTPDFIKSFTFDGNIPEDQCFATVTFDNCRVHVLSRNFDDYLVDLSMMAKCSILEYSFLTLQNLVEPFSMKIEFDLTKDTKTNILTQPITVKYGPLIGHTLGVSLQMWSQALEESLTKDLVILTNYVICNDTNLNFVFGQDETDEKIPLSTRCFHLYSWRSAKSNRKLRVSMERFEWRWSAPFQISQDSTDLVDIGFNCHLFVSVKKLSATQKQVVISGSFVLCNMLTEHFEFKVFENIENDKDRYKKARTHIIEGRSVAPSLLMRHDQRHCLRLRFFGVDSAWTGNIPLEINPKNTQPWLVKVPLEERNNFLSVWCKIITQKFGKHVRCLAVLWPLFMIRSNLSIEAQCKVETPALTLSSTSVVAGKGCYQQLYCPGTSDHSHLLSFHFDNGAPAFNSVVPLNYTLIDQKEIFKKHENEDINGVLDVLNNLEKQKWPFLIDELDDVSWFVEDQPLTHVKVSYKEVCPYSNCLLIELLPWCILVNNLGCSITIVIDNEEACSIRHQGIICPPKMEGDFYLSVDMGTKRYNSQALQLANSEWSKAFYMPRIIGTVPLNGSIQTPIKCGAYICMVSIGSNVYNDMRQLKIGSSHVLVNCMPFQLEVVCFAVPNNENVHSFPKHADKYAFTAAPNLDKNGRGISIIRWYLVDGDINSDFALYMSFAICPVMNWSCPIAVDRGSLRRTGCVKSEEKSIPFVITCQEHKGITYVSIHHDTHPQMRIENRSGKRLYFAQYLKSETPIAKTHVNDAAHFDWVTFAESGETIYYSLPSFSEKFPDLASDSESERLVIAADAKGCSSISSSRWSVPININIFNEHFVRIPYFQDVKVTFISSTQTTFVTIDSISKAEVSAKDIRIRLALHEKQQYFEMTKRAIQSASEKSNYSRSKDSQSYPIFDEKSNNDNNGKLLPIDSVNISSKILNAQRQSFKIQAFLKGITFTLTSDLVGGFVEMKEIVNVICDDVAFVLEQKEKMCVSISLSEIQIDNQMFARGGYDFPVVLISQSPREIKQVFSLDDPIENSIKECQTDPLIGVELVFEKWKDEVTDQNRTDLEKLKVQLRPLSAFIEDNFIFKLKEYFTASTPGNLVLWAPNKKHLIHYSSNFIELPDHIVLESVILANPITLRSLVVDQWSLLLSVHSSIKVYLALDQSPLQFSKFEHRNVMTTPYRLGYAFTLHYLSGALFGAGWVVGSLELLGSPGTLARAMGSGLKDFVSLPYLGLIQGPWAFVRGVTNGSASLMRHLTAGTLQSVTKLAASVARNLDRLTLDEEHFMRTEEYRRHRPRGITQGFLQGLTGLGISLLGAVGGIAHHPLKSIMSEGASPRGLATGVGLGLVGVFTKPLSGAADLIAQTGEGLLQGAGWNTFPEPRIRPVLQHIVACSNSILKYSWKFSREYSPCTIIFVIEATEMTKDGKYVAIALVLHMDVLLIINTDEDIMEHTLSLTDIEAIADANDPTLLSFKLLPPKKSLKITEDDVLEMDPAQRTRVADYVKSTTRLMQFPDDVSLNNSEISVSTCDSSSRIPNETKEVYKFYTYYVNPRSRNYFIKLFNLAKRQHENYSFQFYSN